MTNYGVNISISLDCQQKNPSINHHNKCFSLGKNYICTYCVRNCPKKDDFQERLRSKINSTKCVQHM